MPGQDELEHDLSRMGEDRIFCLSDEFEIARGSGASVLDVAGRGIEIDGGTRHVLSFVKRAGRLRADKQKDAPKRTGNQSITDAQ
jgi:hypothetical protein